MAGDLYYNSDDLSSVANALYECGNEFNQAATKFAESQNPSMGLFFIYLQPLYARAKQSTASYVDDMSAILEAMSKKVDFAISTVAEMEQDNIRMLEKLTSLIESAAEVSRNDSGGDGGMATSPETNGGGTENISYSGSSSSGSMTGGTSAGGSATANNYTTYAPVQPTWSDPTGPDIQVPMPSTSNGTQLPSSVVSDGSQTGNSSSDSRHWDDGSDQTGQVPSDWTDQSGQSSHSHRGDWATRPSHDHITESPTDTDIPETSDAFENDGRTTISFDMDADGEDDAALYLDEGQDVRFSVERTDDGREISIDLDADGDPELSYRVSDDFDGGDVDVSAEAIQDAADQQALDDAWDEIARNDPLGRSGDELRRLFEERDVVDWDADADANVIVSEPVISGAMKGDGQSWDV